MDQKLLFFDIDGTLIAEGSGEIPESTRIAVKEARKQGHLLFINTGRTRTSLPADLLDMGFDGLLCGCGTNIFLEDKEIFSVKLTNEYCKEVIQKMREAKIPVIYESADAVYLDPQMPDFDEWTMAANGLFNIVSRSIEEVLESDDKVYDKLLVLLEPSQKSDELKEYLSEKFICIDRTHNLYEVIQKGYSKATGIHFVCDYLGKSVEDCYAFGDSENDRAMLEAVPNSIAVGNAEEAIKKSCSYVTESVQEDGIYKAMKYFGLI